MEGYVNNPQTIGTVISSGKATMHELDTVYGLEDLHDLLEILAVEAENRNIMSKAREEG